MRSQRCERCGNRIRPLSRTCRHCGTPAGPAEHTASRRRRLGFASVLGAMAMAVAALFFLGPRSVDPGAVAEWYAEMAINHLPRPFSAFAPSESESGAFYFCIRRVVKDGLDDTSVATFPTPAEGRVQALGDGRYRISTHLYEDRPGGERLRREFACTTKFERNRWVLESLSMDDLALR